MTYELAVHWLNDLKKAQKLSADPDRKYSLSMRQLEKLVEMSKKDREAIDSLVNDR